MQHSPFKLKLIASRMLTSRVLQLTFIPPDGLPFLFTPGQFITFLLPDEQGNILRRSYSLANIPEERYRIVIIVSYIDGGFATKILFSLKIGDELLCVGPKGRFMLHEQETVIHYLLVATSTGVAPYHSMLSTLARRLTQDEKLQVTLLLGVRYAKDILYAAEFIDFAQKYPRFYFRAYLSRESICKEWYQYPGYVHSAFDNLPLNPMTDLVYLCGNPHMIDDSMEKLQKVGFHQQQIRHEKYASSKIVPKHS